MNRLSILGLGLALTVASMVGCQKPGEEPKKKVTPGHGGTTPTPEVITHKNLILDEIFYVGTWREADKGATYVAKGWKYDYDQYIKITNPTSEPLYLDGLGLAVSHFQANAMAGLAPEENFMETHFGVSAIVQFPGTGKEHKVDPGQSVIVAARASDHRKSKDGDDGMFNPASLDLSKANFEWLSPEQLKSEDYFDDNKNVPNLIPIYDGSEDFKDPSENLRPFSIGSSSAVALVKLPANPRTELQKDEYLWSYVNRQQNGHHHASGACIKLPNELVLDAVALCPQNTFKWHVLSTTLDKSYTSVSLEASRTNEKESGMAVVRKRDGRQIVDTNDSKLDFEPQRASLFDQK